MPGIRKQSEFMPIINSPTPTFAPSPLVTDQMLDVSMGFHKFFNMSDKFEQLHNLYGKKLLHCIAEDIIQHGSLLQSYKNVATNPDTLR